MISSMRVVAGLGAAALAFSLLSPTPGRADSGDPIQQAYGINYACAGIGKASRADPRWRKFPVKLQFAATNGDFMGDPHVRVMLSTGKIVFEAQCDGPWVLIDLPAGNYKVHATGRNGAAMKDFTLSVRGSHQTSMTIRM
jgi:hypothetical protein